MRAPRSSSRAQAERSIWVPWSECHRACHSLHFDDTTRRPDSRRGHRSFSYPRLLASKNRRKALDAVAVEAVEELLGDLLVGPVASGEPGGVLAPATGAAVLQRDVEVLLALGLDDQAGVVAQPQDEVGVVVAQGAGLGDVLQREPAVHRELGPRRDVGRLVEELREPRLQRAVDGR